MQQEDDLRGLAKTMDFMRALSILFVVINIYWFCYGQIREWGINIGVVDRILLNFDRTAGLFRNILWTKLFAVVFLALSCLGTKGVKEEKITWRKITASLATGGVLFFFNWWLLDLPLPAVANAAFYILTLSAGYICLLMGGVWMSRLLKNNLMDDPFNNENESFQQETRLIENEYSINLPTKFYYNKQWNNGFANVVNPQRACICMGSPGSGKSYCVVNQFIKQQIEKGYTQYIYDYKFPDLSEIAYNHLLNHQKGYKKIPTFYVINFDDPRRSHRCNPIHPDFMTDISDAYESAYTIMLNLNRSWVQKQGDFFCGKPHYPFRGRDLVPAHLRQRAVLYLPARHRVPEQAVRGYFPDSDILPGTRKLPQPLYGCLARRRSRPAPGPDSIGQNSAFPHDFAPAILGHVGR